MGPIRNRAGLAAVVTGLMLLALGALRAAQSSERGGNSHRDALAIETFTADSNAFGVTSTLIYGPTEAILVDAQFRNSDARRLADQIAAKGRKLRAIVITHAHPDHYFGTAVLHERFPGTPIYISGAGLEEFRRTVKAKLDAWTPVYKMEMPTDVPTPTLLPSKRLFVDGRPVDIVAGQQGDVRERSNSYVWIPSLKAVIAGDLVFDGVHVWLAESDATTRPAWQAALRRIQALKPRTVIAGHKRRPEAPDDRDDVAFTIRYIGDFGAARAAAHGADELVAAMKARYPDLGLEVILSIAAQAEFPK